MITGAAQQAVENFLTALRALKGPPGRVALRAEFRHEARGLRGAFADSAAGGSRPEAASHYDGVLPLGGHVRFQVTMPAGGALSLFNLGSSGTCVLLYPPFGQPAPVMAPGAVLHLPLQEPWFRVTGPATAVSGQPDRLLALVSRTPRQLTVADLDPRLTQRFAPRGAGFAGAPRLARPLLFTLEPDQWDYGLLEFEIR